MVSFTLIKASSFRDRVAYASTPMYELFSCDAVDIEPLKSGWVVYGPESGYNFPSSCLLRVKNSRNRTGRLSNNETFNICIVLLLG